ncbi:hypothetical protein M0R45_013811 [Rubus argutus]|uniref:Uncharacterized protein n=1 Tax=Rubus argutus TaxID=59490 RepID=A0AAW1XN07_RUBAR
MSAAAAAAGCGRGESLELQQQQRERGVDLPPPSPSVHGAVAAGSATAEPLRVAEAAGLDHLRSGKDQGPREVLPFLRAPPPSGAVPVPRCGRPGAAGRAHWAANGPRLRENGRAAGDQPVWRTRREAVPEGSEGHAAKARGIAYEKKKRKKPTAPQGQQHDEGGQHGHFASGYGGVGVGVGVGIGVGVGVTQLTKWGYAVGASASAAARGSMMPLSVLNC